MSALRTTQAGFCLALGVDPASPGDGANDVLFLGCVGQGRSTDAGRNFTRLAGLHSDTHAWGFFSPPAAAPTIVYCVTDGGVWRSGDDGVSFRSRNEGGLQSTLIYNLDIKPDSTASESAAAFQDNGSKLAGITPMWRQGLGGDGFDIVYSGTAPTRLMASKNHPNNKGEPQSQVLRSDDDGVNWTDVTPFPASGGDSGLFKPQLAADPSSADVFYATGTANLYQTQDFGTTWRVLTPVKARRSFSFGAAVAVAPTDGNSVVVASGQPTVLVSTNALGAAPTFTNITRNLPGRPVLRVAFDPSDAMVIYAVLGGFAGTGPPGHVFRTTLTSGSWTDISPDLDASFGALALDGRDTPTTIYVGTDVGGVLRSVDLGATWTVLDDLMRVAFRPPAPRGTNGSDAGDGAPPAARGRESDQKCLNFRILTNPFPATVHPGSCLGVLLEYVPTCDSAACCELVIESDDPDLPQRTVMVTGRLRRTLWSVLKCWAAHELSEILEAGSC